MADFGLYTALRGQDAWAQKRSDEQNEVNLAERMRQNSEQKLEANSAAQQYMQQYFDQIGQLDVLEQDQKRINEVEKQARQNIVQGVTRFNGDIRRYMASGGLMDLGEYKRSIMGSEVTKNAMRNKANYAQLLKAKAEGKYLLPVQMQVTGKDEKGNPVQRTEYVSPDQQLRLFDEGKITSLDFAGAEDKVNVDMMDFKDKFKDAKDPYSRNNIVQESEIYTVAIGKGASEAQARELANKYGKTVKQGGQPWYWGAGDVQKLNLEKQRVSQGWANVNLRKRALDMKEEANRKQNLMFTEAMKLQPGQVSPNLNPVMANQLEQTVGVSKAKDDKIGEFGKYAGKGFIFSRENGMAPVNLSNSRLVGRPQFTNIDGKVYMKYTALHGDVGSSALPFSDGGNAVAEDSYWPGFGDYVKGQYGSAVGYDGDVGEYKSDVLIPVDDIIRDPYNQAIYQMKYPKGGDIEMKTPGTITGEMLMNQGVQNIMNGGQ